MVFPPSSQNSDSVGDRKSYERSLDSPPTDNEVSQEANQPSDCDDMEFDSQPSNPPSENEDSQDSPPSEYQHSPPSDSNSPPMDNDSDRDSPPSDCEPNFDSPPPDSEQERDPPSDHEESQHSLSSECQQSPRSPQSNYEPSSDSPPPDSEQERDTTSADEDSQHSPPSDCSPSDHENRCDFPSSDSYYPVKFFSHVTTRSNKDLIELTGLQPRPSRDKKYDGFLTLSSMARLRGIWYLATKFLSKKSCYPIWDDSPRNPMLSFEPKQIDLMCPLAECEWFEISQYKSGESANVKIAIIPINHPAMGEIMKNRLATSCRIQDKENYRFFRIGADGKYYVPWDAWVSVFIVGDDTVTLEGSLKPMWTEVERCWFG